MMMLTHEDAALRLCHELLQARQGQRGRRHRRRVPALRDEPRGLPAEGQCHAYGTDFNIPVMYFTQLAGLALGADPKELGIDKQIISCEPVSLRSRRERRGGEPR